MSANDIWYYARSDGSAVGPLTRDQLHRLWRDRTVSTSTLVWDNQSFDWRPLKKTVVATYLGGEHDIELPPAPDWLTAIEQPNKRAAKPPTPAQKDKSDRRAAVQRSRAERSAKSKSRASTNAVPPKFPGTAPRSEPEIPASSSDDPATTDRVGWAARRWCARLFDLCVSGPLALMLVLLIVHANDPVSAAWLLQWLSQPLLIFPAALVIWIPFEALSLSLFGTTPGKALWGIEVGSLSHGKLNLYRALQRSVSVVIRGLFLGIPPITLLSQGWALVTYINQGQTSWDLASGAKLSFAPIGGNRIAAALFASIGAASLLLDGSSWLWLLELYQHIQTLI